MKSVINLELIQCKKSIEISFLMFKYPFCHKLSQRGKMEDDVIYEVINREMTRSVE